LEVRGCAQGAIFTETVVIVFFLLLSVTARVILPLEILDVLEGDKRTVRVEPDPCKVTDPAGKSKPLAEQVTTRS
jgi:hypothetical protein